LAGEEIPLTARVLAVADTFDAITTHRSYRQARNADKAAQIIQECAGTQFDPRCAEAFLAVLSSGQLERGPKRATRFMPEED